MDIRGITVWGLVALVSILHFTAVGGAHGLHMIHRELYFLPILLAGFWFGLSRAMAVAAVTAGLYAAGMYAQGEHGFNAMAVWLQVAVFLLVGLLVGWLAHRSEKQQQRAAAAERAAAVGRAASAVAVEVEDIGSALERLSDRGERLGDAERAAEFRAELRRLRALVAALGEQIPKTEFRPVSRDVNEVVAEHSPDWRQWCTAAGLSLQVEADEGGCPTQVAGEALDRLFDALVENAVEASQPGGRVVVRTIRGGETCTFEVEDQGHGVTEENLAKIFTPFFTTKRHGSGLALSAGRKVVRDMGGDMHVKSRPGEGALFRIVIPRDAEYVTFPGKTASGE